MVSTQPFDGSMERPEIVSVEHDLPGSCVLGQIVVWATANRLAAHTGSSCPVLFTGRLLLCLTE